MFKNIIKYTTIVIASPFLAMILILFIIAETAGNVYYWANGQ